MSLEVFRAEYQTVGIGPQMFDALRRLCKQATRGWPADIYAEPAERWDDDAIDDLLQELVTERLLHPTENQLAYVMDTAATTADFERLVIFQARRTLRSRLQRTLVDNLLARCGDVLEGDEFERHGSDPVRHRLRGVEVEIRDPTPAEIRNAALAARMVPRMRANPSPGRLPVVYSAERLRKLVFVVAHSLDSTFSKRDLRQILEVLFAAWLPIDLDRNAEADWASDGSDLDAESKLAVEAAVIEARETMSGEQRAITRMTMLGVSDQDAAQILGISRPTLAKRKREALSLLGVIVEEMDEASQRAYVSLLGEALMDEELSHGG